jgi:transposase
MDSSTRPLYQVNRERLRHPLDSAKFQEQDALLRRAVDNNASERAGRGPAVARKNFYGSGSLWSGRLAASMFSLLATLAHWKINPRLWLGWYLESCAAAGGKSPDDIGQFLPWNLSPERRMALAERAASPSTADTS